jgi:hypothetical protein
MGYNYVYIWTLLAQTQNKKALDLCLNLKGGEGFSYLDPVFLDPGQELNF